MFKFRYKFSLKFISFVICRCCNKIISTVRISVVVFQRNILICYMMITILKIIYNMYKFCKIQMTMFILFLLLQSVYIYGAEHTIKNENFSSRRSLYIFQSTYNTIHRTPELLQTFHNDQIILHSQYPHIYVCILI